MFGAQKDPSRTEEATPKRVKKQREEGNVPKSAELGKAVSLAGGMMALSVWIGPMADSIKAVFRRFLVHSWEFDPNPQNVYVLTQELMIELCKIIMPIILFLAFLGFLAQRIQVGKLWTTKVFKFKWQRFNIFKGIKQMMFSPQTALRTIKSLLFAIILCIIPGWIIWQEHENFLPMYYATTEGVAAYMLQMAFKLACYALVPILAITAFDVWQSRFAYKEGMKMTKDEVKDERKQADGDPVIKNKQRQKMMQVMMQRMLQDVPKADVVVTNPTHIAVALRYNADEFPAPVVLAKGADHLAEKIKAVAREHNVPIRENVPLARALYKAVEIGDMIPEELYKAVATLLASIWKLKPRAAA
ncbi:MAG: flagellar biosynthesis protein FlhB [Desulfovibrio sp.]|uniref:flagellar biosynthesis protein FlhB n=1 Tax=Desulfovibrio sp. TaxID=885 RepID=UPI001A6EF16F|nr:flagellar biosynthesis protein FlhB [Desulfovibrio sp.]MBD5417730.1 flagellar biosynthesis protein FlhB [Desulfovibrio sp.]